MKKTFLTAFAALLVAIPAVQAQKVNKSGLLTKIEKSDADIADAKKGAKAATWINRGKAFYERLSNRRRTFSSIWTPRCSSWPSANPPRPNR